MSAEKTSQGGSHYSVAVDTGTTQPERLLTSEQLNEKHCDNIALCELWTHTVRTINTFDGPAFGLR